MYLNAWYDLDWERNVSEYEPISRRACFDYAHDYGFDALQTEDLWYYVARMDREYLTWKHKNAPKQREPKPDPSGRTKHRVR